LKHEEKERKRELCAIKLDMQKAYNRVEWNFLEKIMVNMACVSSVKYRVRFNSIETEPIIPTRGLRQGDPLSPYLYVLVAEGLSCMIKGAKERGDLEGVKVCREALVISHLFFFSDDSLFLMHADRKNAECWTNILNRHCENSG
jgi:hypothetical protein